MHYKLQYKIFFIFNTVSIHYCWKLAIIEQLSPAPSLAQGGWRLSTVQPCSLLLICLFLGSLYLSPYPILMPNCNQLLSMCCLFICILNKRPFRKAHWLRTRSAKSEQFPRLPVPLYSPLKNAYVLTKLFWHPKSLKKSWNDTAYTTQILSGVHTALHANALTEVSKIRCSISLVCLFPPNWACAPSFP